MKYKCKNCGQEYIEKPDYCDCGNNVFIILYTEINTNSVSLSKSAETNRAFNNFQNRKINDLNQKIKNTTSESSKTQQITLIVAASVSFIISLACFLILILKAVSLPSAKQNDPPHALKAVKIQEYIPEIDTYWDNSAAAKNSVKQKTEINAISEKNDFFSDIIPEKKVQLSNKTHINKQIVPNKISTQKKTQKNPDQTQKTQTQSDKNTGVLQNNNNNKVNNSINEDKENTAPAKTEKEKITNAAELSEYKNALRLRLFKYFPILNVVGSGSAQIGFTISPEGKLLNRRFVIQSENKSLNDALYHMLMRTPSYNPPPKSYNGEEIILKMDFNNGYYSFSYIK